jgi:hypothetical protein
MSIGLPRERRIRERAEQRVGCQKRSFCPVSYDQEGVAGYKRSEVKVAGKYGYRFA